MTQFTTGGVSPRFVLPITCRKRPTLACSRALDFCWWGVVGHPQAVDCSFLIVFIGARTGSCNAAVHPVGEDVLPPQTLSL